MISFLLLFQYSAGGLVDVHVDYAVKTANMKHFYSVATRLQEKWHEMATMEGWPVAFREMGESVASAPSALHGRGLFANAPIAKGTVITFYPVDALGDAQNALALSRYDSLGQRDYKVELFHSLLFGWAEDLWIDADPAKELIPGWLGHLLNDASVCASDEPEEVDRYWREVDAKANCDLVPFGDACPLMCIVTTRDVEAGAELLQPYGHDYWTQVGSEDGNDAARQHFEKKLACARAVEDAYDVEIESLADLLIKQLPHTLVDMAIPNPAAPSDDAVAPKAKVAARRAKVATAKKREASRDVARGFGAAASGGSEQQESRGANSKRKKKKR